MLLVKDIFPDGFDHLLVDRTTETEPSQGEEAYQVATNYLPEGFRADVIDLFNLSCLASVVVGSIDSVSFDPLVSRLF